MEGDDACYDEVITTTGNIDDSELCDWEDFADSTVVQSTKRGNL